MQQVITLLEKWSLLSPRLLESTSKCWIMVLVL